MTAISAARVLNRGHAWLPKTLPRLFVGGVLSSLARISVSLGEDLSSPLTLRRYLSAGKTAADSKGHCGQLWLAAYKCAF